MDWLITRELNNELIELDKVFKETINPWWDSTYSYYQQLLSDITWKTLPPVIIAAYRYLGCEEQVITFANIFRTAYFAHHIHAAVRDDEEGQEHNREMQFGILIGDYFFGRLLKLLVEADNKKILVPFAAMICSMNEGMVIKHKIDANNNQVVEKTKASIYATAFLSAAINAEKNAEFCEIYRELGFNLGMCIELSYDTNLRGTALQYLFKTAEIFEQIDKEYHSKNNLLDNVINQMKDILAETKAAAAV